MIFNKETGCRIRSTSASENLINRLENWKFESALKHLRGQPRAVQSSVRALSRLLGNSGWLDGDIGELVTLAVEDLTGNREQLGPG
jgi:hypothetical protein